MLENEKFGGQKTCQKEDDTQGEDTEKQPTLKWRWQEKRPPPQQKNDEDEPTEENKNRHKTKTK